jgi:hypothetical protein
MAAPSQLRPNPTTTDTLAALENKYVFLSGSQLWQRVTSGEIGITEANTANTPPGEIGVSAPSPRAAARQSAS